MNKGALLNLLSLAVFAVFVAVLSFAWLGGSAESTAANWVISEGAGFDQEIIASQVVEFTLNGRDTVALLPGAAATLNWDKETSRLKIDLKQGGVFFGALAGDFEATVDTGFAQISSAGSIAYVGLDEFGTATVFAVEHSSLVTFLADGVNLNSLNVPNGYKMKIPASKVTQTLGRLRLTKLIKEFPVFEFEDVDLPADLQPVLAEVNGFYSANSLTFLADLQSGGDTGPSQTGIGGKVNGVWELIRDFLTFSARAREEYLKGQGENHLIFAMTNFLYNNSDSGDLWLSKWIVTAHSAKTLDALHSDLFFVLPGVELYPVKDAVFGKLNPNPDLAFYHQKLNEIESLLSASDSVAASQAYDSYEQNFSSTLSGDGFDDPALITDIMREYTLIELMLRGNSVFYTSERVAFLKTLEEKVLTLAGTDTDLSEEKQSFVQSKLRFLRNLFVFVEDRRVSIKDATKLADELIYDSETYMAGIPESLAVKEYFASELENFKLSNEFINSPEFYSYTSFEDGLAAYKAKKSDLADLNSYLQNVRSGGDDSGAPVISLSTAVSDVKKALSSGGIKYSDVVSLGDSENRLFEIKDASASGYPFAGKFDRVTKILYDVVVGEVRFSTGLSLESAGEVIKNAVEGGTGSDDFSTDGGGDSGADLPATSSAQAAAISLVKKAFEGVGIDTAGFDFKVMDLEKNIFTFEGAVGDSGATISGSYDLNSGMATEIVCGSSGEVELLGDSELAGLSEMVDVCR
ncbi:MAG: hypothetical protein WC846_04240 [Candidatus Gracilibacteria bacterium]|jgi:hypothetical protein